MKKVGTVLDNIKELDEQYKVISNIVNIMSSDDEIANFIFKKLGTDQNTLLNISSTLLSRKFDLEGQLRDSEVDVR